MIRDTAREFVEEHVKPDVGDHFEAGTFPRELVPKMGELGFYAPNIEGYGSPNVSETAYGLLMQELEAAVDRDRVSVLHTPHHERASE
jgi:glutaryl-CoA dehydrogenase